jgi:hypothetical protein
VIILTSFAKYWMASAENLHKSNKTNYRAGKRKEMCGMIKFRCMRQFSKRHVEFLTTKYPLKFESASL